MMILFWIILLVMTAIAVVFVLLPLLYQKHLLKEKLNFLSFLFLSLFLSVFSMYFYLQWGDSKGLATYYFQKEHAAQIQAEIKKFKSPQQLIDKMVVVLQQHPDSAQGWFLLGRLYNSTNQFKEAETAFAKAIQYDAKNLNYKLQYVQASFLANNKKLSKQALHYLTDIRKIQPNNPSVINLIAMNAFSEKRYQTAITNWLLLLNDFPANTADGKMIMQAIQEAQKRLDRNTINHVTHQAK